MRAVVANACRKILPVITMQPTSQTVTVGATASFNVTASGATPLHFQWSLNTTNIAGATNAHVVPEQCATLPGR